VGWGRSVTRQLKREFRLIEGVHYRVSGTGCWEWLGYINPSGYGEHRSGIAGEKLAHRGSYALVHGPLEKGAGHVHHKCENKPCINPDHLELLTPVEHRTLHGQADSTLEWDDVRAIRAAWKAGTRGLELCERYGLAWGTLYPLLQNQTWIDPAFTPGREATCPECDEQFIARRVHQKFCCPKHRDLWNQRRWSRTRRGRAADGSDTRTYVRRAA
jgi:HNH endonuclease